MLMNEDLINNEVEYAYEFDIVRWKRKEVNEDWSMPECHGRSSRGADVCFVPSIVHHYLCLNAYYYIGNFSDAVGAEYYIDGTMSNTD